MVAVLYAEKEINSYKTYKPITITKVD